MQEYNKFELKSSLKAHAERLIPTCILASSSERRFELLKELDINPIVVKVSAEEDERRIADPFELTKSNALLKQYAFYEAYPKDSVVYPLLTADTVVAVSLSLLKDMHTFQSTESVLDNDYIVLGKPKDEKEAVFMLSLLKRAKVHKVITTIALSFFEPYSNKYETFTVADSATLVFKDGVSEEDIKNYIKNTSDVLKAAGSYKLQNNEDALFSALYGDRTTVEGLSYTALYSVLTQMDVAFFGN